MHLEEFDIEFLAQKMSENPGSMLFARLADLYLTKEQNAEAMKLLEEGIPNFPEYYAGYIVLGKAHLAFREYSRAHAAFSKALELSPFNQTAAQLLTTVPDKPDESTRTTAENYFSAPGASSAAVPAAAPAPEPAAEAVTSYEEPTPYVPAPEPAPVYEIPQSQTDAGIETSVEEMGFTQSAPDPYLSALESDQSYAAQSEPQYEYGGTAETFPTYDEYFAQNQHRIDTANPVRLDDYLNGSVTAAAEPAAVPVYEPEEEPPSHEFVNENYVEPEPAAGSPFTSAVSEEHLEPEPVFSSPEQAQLFAEMTGSAEPEPASFGTDLDSLTEKLQDAEKIVPEKDYQPKTPVPQEVPDDQAYETEAVTPTLAEIYASQGEYRAAIQAYEILMFSQPAKGGDYQKRIRELQKLQMEKDGLL